MFVSVAQRLFQLITAIQLCRGNCIIDLGGVLFLVLCEDLLMKTRVTRLVCYRLLSLPQFFAFLHAFCFLFFPFFFVLHWPPISCFPFAVIHIFPIVVLQAII